MIIWAAITAFLGRWLNTIMIGGALAMAAVIGVLWLQLSSAHSDVEKLKVEKAGLQASIASLTEESAQKTLAINALEATNLKLQDQARTTNDILEEIKRATPAEDGPIAPVLERLLHRLDGLRGGEHAR